MNYMEREDIQALFRPGMNIHLRWSDQKLWAETLHLLQTCISFTFTMDFIKEVVSDFRNNKVRRCLFERTAQVKSCCTSKGTNFAHFCECIICIKCYLKSKISFQDLYHPPILQHLAISTRQSRLIITVSKKALDKKQSWIMSHETMPPFSTQST